MLFVDITAGHFENHIKQTTNSVGRMHTVFMSKQVVRTCRGNNGFKAMTCVLIFMQGLQHGSSTVGVDPSGCAVKGAGLRPLACWVAGTAGSNPTDGMGVCLLRVLCTVRLTPLRRADHPSRGVLPSVVCLNVIVAH